MLLWFPPGVRHQTRDKPKSWCLSRLSAGWKPSKLKKNKTRRVLFPAKTPPKAFSEPLVDSPVLLRAFYKLFLAVSDATVQQAGDKYERVPATLGSSPAQFELDRVHAGGKPRLEAGKWRCQEVGCTSLTPRPFFFFVQLPCSQSSDRGVWRRRVSTYVYITSK